MTPAADEAAQLSVLTEDDTDKLCPATQREMYLSSIDRQSYAIMPPSQAKESLWAEWKSILEDRTFYGWEKLPKEIQGLICEHLPPPSLASAMRAHSSLNDWVKDMIPRRITLGFSHNVGLHTSNPLHKATDEKADKIRDRIRDVTIRLSPNVPPQDPIADDISTSMQNRKLRFLRIQSSTARADLTIERLVKALPCQTLIIDANSALTTSSAFVLSSGDHDWVPSPLTTVKDIVLIHGGSDLHTHCSVTRDVSAERSKSIVTLDDNGDVKHVISQHSLPGSRLGRAKWTVAPEDPDIPYRLLLEQGGVLRARREDEVTDDEDGQSAWIREETALHTVMDIPAAARELSEVMDYLDETRKEEQGEWKLQKDELNGILYLTLEDMPLT